MYLDDSGTAKCSFEASHENIARIRMKGQDKAVETKKKKK